MSQKPNRSEPPEVIRIDDGRVLPDAVVRDLAARCVLVEYPLPWRLQRKTKAER